VLTLPDAHSLPLTRSPRLAFILSVALSALLAVVAGAGLLYGARGLYRPNPATLPTFLGQDALTLLVGLPLLLGALWFTRRGSVRGLLLWLGMLVYVAYSYTYYLISPEFNTFYLAYVAIVSMSGYALLYLLLSVDAPAVQERFASTTPVRLVGGFLAFFALLMTIKWVTSIVAALSSGTPPPAKELGVWPMDLVVAFPAMFWGGVWLWRRQPLGYVVGALLLVKAASVGLTLVVSSWLVMWWGQPLDQLLPVYACIGAGSLALALLFLRGIRPYGEVARRLARAQLAQIG